MNNPISIQNFKEKLHRMVTEFPLSCVFAVLLSVTFIYMIVNECGNSAVIYYFTAGYLLTLMLKLWGDEVGNKRTALLAGIAAHAVLLTDAVVLFIRCPDGFGASSAIAHFAVYLALVLGIFFLPFFREKNDMASWNFVRSIMFSAVISFAIGCVMTAGMMLLLYGIDVMFGISMGQKVYGSVAVIFMQLLPMLLILSRIPMDGERHNRQPFVSGFLNGITRYLFIPLICLYVIVLYVHLFCILLAWELPNGMVSMLVSAMMIGIILVEFLLYPTVQSGAAKRFELLIVKWMPIVALPLLVLMTVGIVRRFDDYGVTANRLYLLTLNLWFYLVCIGLYLSRARRIHWVSLSFCALLLLTSAHPFNFYELVRMSMTAKVKAVMEKYPPSKLPIDGNTDMRSWINTLPENQRRATYSRLSYLIRNYSYDDTKDMAESVYLYERFEDFVSTDGTGYDNVLFDYTLDGKRAIEIPDGYSHVIESYITVQEPVEQGRDSITMSVDIGTDLMSAEFVISRRALKAYSKSDRQPIFIDKTGTVAFRPNRLHISDNSTTYSINGDGYFFLK